MTKITLTSIVEGILKNTNKSYKILSSAPKKTRFKINCESVQLFGTVTDKEYSMQIKKLDGSVLDSVKCGISQTDDIFNRINESISTGVKLSKYVNAVTDAKKDYLTPGYIKEDVDEDEKDKEILLDDEEDIETETVDLRSALENIIDQLMILAEDASDCVDLVSGTENDADNKSTMVSIMGGMYSLADDVQSFIEDLYPVEEQDECYKKESKNRNIKKEVANKLSEAALLIRNNKELKNVKEAIRVVKSSLIAD